jgi:hypothetical protein
MVCGCANLPVTTTAPLSPGYASTPYWWGGVDAAFAGRRWPVVPPPARVPWLLPVAGWWYQGRDGLGL